MSESEPTTTEPTSALVRLPADEEALRNEIIDLFEELRKILSRHDLTAEKDIIIAHALIQKMWGEQGDLNPQSLAQYKEEYADKTASELIKLQTYRVSKEGETKAQRSRLEADIQIAFAKLQAFLGKKENINYKIKPEIALEEFVAHEMETTLDVAFIQAAISSTVTETIDTQVVVNAASNLFGDNSRVEQRIQQYKNRKVDHDLAKLAVAGGINAFAQVLFFSILRTEIQLHGISSHLLILIPLFLAISITGGGMLKMQIDNWKRPSPATKRHMLKYYTKANLPPEAKKFVDDILAAQKTMAEANAYEEAPIRVEKLLAARNSLVEAFSILSQNKDQLLSKYQKTKIVAELTEPEEPQTKKTLPPKVRVADQPASNNHPENLVYVQVPDNFDSGKKSKA